MEHPNGNLTDKDKKHTSRKKEPSYVAEKRLFSRVEKVGLDYVERKERYLIASLCVPIFVGIIQIFNIVFISNQNPPPVSNDPNVPPPPDLGTITPGIILLIVCVTALVKFILLLNWNGTLKQYKSISLQLASSPNHLVVEKPGKTRSLTQLFYKMIDSMEKVKYLIYIILIVFVISLISLAENFNIRNLTPPPGKEYGETELYQWMNLVSIIVLFHYILFETKAFLQWSRKLKRLNAFEADMFQDVNLDE